MRKRFVANADTAFKVFQTIIFLPFASQFVKLTKLFIPGNKEGEEEDNGLHLEYIRKASSKFVPSTAVVEIIQEIERMAGLARENLVASMEALADKNLDKVKEINAREKIIDYLSSEITDYLVEVNRYELPLADSRRLVLFSMLLSTLNGLETTQSISLRMRRREVSLTRSSPEPERKNLQQCIQKFFSFLIRVWKCSSQIKRTTLMRSLTWKMM